MDFLKYFASNFIGNWYIWTLQQHIQIFKIVEAVAGVNKRISRMARPKAPEVPVLAQLLKKLFEYVKCCLHCFFDSPIME